VQGDANVNLCPVPSNWTWRVADSNNDNAAVWRLVSAEADAAAVVSVCIVLLREIEMKARCERS
jgi:hypothetical protein